MNIPELVRDEFWHLLCHRSELPQFGSFLKLNWLEQEVVVFNDGGDIVVFDNVCPHRGTRFFTAAHGVGAISCPYHKWTFRAGKMRIPFKEKYSEADLERAQLNMLKNDWCADFLFVSITPRTSLADQLGSMFGLVASISRNITGRSDFSGYIFESDWRVAIENALEPLHVPYIHPDSLAQLDLTAGSNDFTEWCSVWYSSVGNARMLKRLQAIKKLFKIEFQYEGYMSIYLFPFTMLSSTFGYSYSLQNFFPSHEKNKTHFSSRLLSGATKSEAASVALQEFFQSTAELNRRVFSEDHEICKRISPGFIDANKSTILSIDESKVAHFRKCLKDATTP